MMLAMKDDMQYRPVAKSLIIGLGKTGFACAKFLSQKGEAFCVADTRQKPPMYENYIQQWSVDSVRLGRFDYDLLKGIGRIIVSPGVSHEEPLLQEALRRDIEVMSDIELFAWHATAPIIAITGSNGKSTVTTLLGEMIKAAGFSVKVGGNLGTPAVDLISQPEPDFYVLEVSSFHLDLTHYLPTLASVVLNVSEDHMDRYSSYKDYAVSKRRVYHQAALGVINRDDRAVLRMQDEVPRTISFTRFEPNAGEFGLRDVNGKCWLALGQQNLLCVDDLIIKGAHNYSNVLAALALGHSINLPMMTMLNAAKEFKGLPHRCQHVAKINDVEWINDSKATNVGAAIEAMKSIGGNIILIAGGEGKKANFDEFGQAAREHVRQAVLIGQAAPAIAEAIKDGGVSFAASMDEAVLKASALANAGDVVLLSPGCSSLDMFSSYEERGNAFMQAVHALEVKQ